MLTVLPMALSLLMVVRTFNGDLDAAEAICDDIDIILSVTGHPLPQFARTFVAAYRGQVEEVERRAEELRRDAHERGEGYALTVANMAEALVYNGAGRYQEALESGRGELPYSHELGHAMRTLLEVVEAATRTGEDAIAQEAVARLADVTRPAGESQWALAFMALAEAQLRDGDEGEDLFRAAIDGFDRLRVPMLKGRGQLLYGEMLRRVNRRVDARLQLRAAYDELTACGMAGFAERAERELRATGETVSRTSAGHRRRAHGPGAERGPVGARRPHQPRDRGAHVHQRAHRRVAHAQGVREARDQVTDRAEDRPAGRRRVTGPPPCPPPRLLAQAIDRLDTCPRGPLRERRVVQGWPRPLRSLRSRDGRAVHDT